MTCPASNRAPRESTEARCGSSGPTRADHRRRRVAFVRRRTYDEATPLPGVLTTTSDRTTKESTHEHHPHPPLHRLARGGRRSAQRPGQPRPRPARAAAFVRVTRHRRAQGRGPHGRRHGPAVGRGAVARGRDARRRLSRAS
ncbi:hypothetical protein FRIGORI9N_150007 [Frigoribacterium sp. 9N]|nr:hypothetical protein FRIGORI9N_150007 [Frigoribacterium sp. 9N]